MTGAFHRLAVIAPALAIYSHYAESGNALAGIFALLACLAGGTGPDWLEIPVLNGARLIPHRRITHWMLFWILVFAVSVLGAVTNPALAALAAGFSLGCLVHLSGDVLTPMGVPLIHPWNRTSLAIVHSTVGEFLWVIGMWSLSGIYYVVNHV